MTAVLAVAILIGANQIRSETMAVPVAMAVGDHWLITDPVLYWDGEVSPTHPVSVVLTGSVQAGPNSPIASNQGGMATTLAVQMDGGVAMQLYRKLGEIGRTMGWLHQTAT